jgi:transcriptional regulator GlxA family with amidase domain
METLFTMSATELNRLQVIQRLHEKRLKQYEAAKLLSLSLRQIKRLYKAYLNHVASGLINRKRGNLSNNLIRVKYKISIPIDVLTFSLKIFCL